MTNEEILTKLIDFKEFIEQCSRTTNSSERLLERFYKEKSFAFSNNLEKYYQNLYQTEYKFIKHFLDYKRRNQNTRMEKAYEDSCDHLIRDVNEEIRRITL